MRPRPDHSSPEGPRYFAGDALRLGAVTWSPLGGGLLTGKYRKGKKGRAEGFGGKIFQLENSAQRTQILDIALRCAWANAPGTGRRADQASTLPW